MIDFCEEKIDDQLAVLIAGSGFYCQAYRYGDANSDRYLVHATTSQNPASIMTVAMDEHERRGGKYGLAVRKWPSREIVYYLPSARGEENPKEIE